MPQVIKFLPLQQQHFLLIEQWLALPHVARWWGEGIQWPYARVKEKYTTYVDGYVQGNNKKLPIQALIIEINGTCAGYVQVYNVHDFSTHNEIARLPNPTAGIDLYIGDPSFIGKGLSTAIIKQFLQQFVWPHFETCIADPDQKNLIAIKTFARAGFIPIKNTCLMILHRS